MGIKEVTLERLQAVKAAAAENGIVLTPEEAYRAAGGKVFKRSAKRSKKKAKRGRGWSPVLPGSFESAAR